MVTEINTDKNRVVRHLAIIMDGNGRWAKNRGLERIAGHQRGVDSVTAVVEECLKQGIRYLSLYAFSSENWGRPQDEVNALMELLLHFVRLQRDKMLENGIRLKVIGDVSKLSCPVRDALEETMAATSAGECLTLTLALSYGGRDEIVRALKKMAVELCQGELSIDALSSELLCGYLDTADLPDPDLLIRTGGEKRISNFLLWQSAYTELYFTDVQWPDFNADELSKALQDFRQRNRRFGLIDEQLTSEQKEKCH